ncbi:MAG: PEP-CTERM sorting domain-containing protein, partial [Verrucomicrobiales bacterium]|nr:PEP-CTERM sorting domain-containing protein [Verrucomicrobiales bacterium]
GSNFFSNVMALTGGTGDVTITADSFTAVSPSTFTSIGTLTAIPEPSSAIFMAIGCGLLLYFRRRR